MSYYEDFKNVLDQEAQAILRVRDLIEEQEVEQLISIFEYLSTTGNELVVTGVGKSGNIGQKIVSTFNSIGLRSSFLHPVEALHGDLGRLRSSDAVMFLSKSGTTEEIVKLIPYLPVPKERRIGLLGSIDSQIANECHVLLDCSVEKEACINNQAPTTSSTVTIAVGDAIAVIFEKFVGLSREGFASNHPGGLLGKSLSLKVKHLMNGYEECAKAELGENFQDVLLRMTEYPLGVCAILEKGLFRGVIVEGDVRRTLTEHKDLNIDVAKVYNSAPITVAPNDLAINALKLMENRERPLNAVPVVDGEKFLGVLRLHDLFKAGLSV